MTELYDYNHQSKYIYKMNEMNNLVYIFEIILKKNNQKTKTIRKIKKNKEGNLISLNENIKFNEIKKFNLTAIDINYPTNEIIVNLSLDHHNDYSTYIDDRIYLEFISKSDILECNYNIL
jgi:predicted ATPase with chaperone activity